MQNLPYLTFADDSKEFLYMQQRRAELGGHLPSRRTKSYALDVPVLSDFKALLEASAEGRETSTTMAFVRLLNILVKDKNIGKRIVPIVPDESELSAWKACSDNWVSGHRLGNCILRKMLIN